MTSWGGEGAQEQITLKLKYNLKKKNQFKGTTIVFSEPVNMWVVKPLIRNVTEKNLHFLVKLGLIIFYLFFTRWERRT